MNTLEKQMEEMYNKGIEAGKNEILKNGTPSNKGFKSPMESKNSGEDWLKAYIKSTFEAQRKYKNTEPETISMAAKSLADKYKTGDFDMVSKALTENSETDGGYLAFPEYSSQYIDLIYPPTSIRNIPGVTTYTMSGKNLIIPRGTSGSQSYWGDEVIDDTYVTESANKFGNIILTPHDLYAYIRVSQDMIDDQSLNIVDIVSKDLIKYASIAEEAAFWNGSGSTFTPKGITNCAYSKNASVTPSFVTANSNTSSYNTLSKAIADFNGATPTLVWPELDLNLALDAIREGTDDTGRVNYITDDITWCMNWATYFQLSQLKTKNYGTLIFPELREKQMLLDSPVKIIATANNTSYKIYAVTGANIMIGDRLGIQLMIDPPQSVIKVAPNQHLLFLRKRVDIALKYNTAMSWINYAGK